MNEDGDFSDESANMLEEEYIDKEFYDVVTEESGIKYSTEVALHSYTRNPSLVCVDSDANTSRIKLDKVAQDQ